MTVAELIMKLNEFKQDAPVVIEDADTHWYFTNFKVDTDIADRVVVLGVDAIYDPSTYVYEIEEVK